jgi:uracil-DNA glycosylase
LAKRRRRDSLEGYCRLGDFHGGYYECCFVSPWTKSAHNVDAEVMLLGQDWSSSDSLNRPLNARMRETRKLGQTLKLRTNAHLRELLGQNMQLEFRDTYATNVFVFIKNGAMSSKIRSTDMRYCAEKYAIPQMGIIAPKMAICLGRDTFDAIRNSLHKERPLFSEAYYPQYCIDHHGTEIYGVPHPGSLGTRNAGGKARVKEIWRILGDRLMELRDGGVGLVTSSPHGNPP